MSGTDSLPDSYQLGPFKIKGKENLLVTPEGDIVVLPKVMALLIYLCRHSQKVVSFDELNAAIWPREVVGDNAIYNLVGQLRKVLGDKASKPTYIQTVSKVGYRLLVTAEPIFEEVDKPNAENDFPQNEGKHSNISRFISVVFGILLIGVSWFMLSPFEQQAPLQEDKRQLQLAYYQLYRGDSEGVDQAIETLQRLTATAPDWSLPKVELAYAFIRNAKLSPDNNEFWLSKARAIAGDRRLGKAGVRLSEVLAFTVEPNDITLLVPVFDGATLTSERLALSDLLFQRGKTQEALTQLQSALENCLDCPHVYRKLATTQMVLGNVEEGFSSFSQYRMLINRRGEDPIDNAGNIPLNLTSLHAMANWHFQQPMPTNLLKHQRNTLALFYLTLGKIDLAEGLINYQASNATDFFDLYTLAAIAGAKGDFEKSYTFLKKRQALFPENDRFKLSVVYALWQLGRYEDAMTAFRQYEILSESEVLPDVLPFPTWSLYAGLLLKTGDSAKGERILEAMEKQLQAGLVTGSQLRDTRLASVFALQGREQQALNQLEIAIKQGWVSDFNQNWWYLKDSPYFKILNDDERFQQLVTRYEEGIASGIASLNNQ